MKKENCIKCGKPIALITLGNERITREEYNSLALSVPNHNICVDCLKKEEEQVK